MVQINFALKEVNCKVVYYGPGMSGKTTNLEVVHQKAPEENKGELTSISTDGDRTLFFDFMPLDLGNVAGMRTKFQLYTVPGQVYYNSTRKLVLQGVDGVIFIADSDADKLAENIESYENLIENLAEIHKDIRELPHVIQYNKRDHPNALPVAELDRQLNKYGVPAFEAVARSGEGVFPTLKSLAGLVLESIDRISQRPQQRPAVQRQAPAPRPRQPERSAEADEVEEAPAAPAARRARPAQGQRSGAARKPRTAGAAASGSSARRSSGTARKSPAGRTQNAGGKRRRSSQAEPAQPDVTEKKGSGAVLAVAATVLLAAACAGVVYFFMNGKAI